MAIKGVGQPIRKDVADQLKRRQEIISAKNRGDKEFQYLLSRSSWVRLSSGVNILSDQEIQSLLKGINLTTIKGSNQLAGYNILQGGILNPDRTLRQGLNFTGRTSDTSLGNRNAYQNNKDSYGVRPMPGITGASIKSKNTFGTLREAEVKISCWSLEDFEIIERLYLRPGFSILLEWGHSPYVDNNGNIQTIVETVPNEFFKSETTHADLLLNIEEIRRKTSYNYDAMIGYVKNISWNYLQNGGYECTVSIISTGEVVESVSMRVDPTTKLVEKDPTTTVAAQSLAAAKYVFQSNAVLSGIAALAEQTVSFFTGDRTFSEAQEELKIGKKSPYHLFSQILENYETKGYFNRESLSNKNLSKIQSEFLSKLDPFDGFYQKVDYKDSANMFFDSTIHTHYIPLRVILDIFNSFITPIDPTKKNEPTVKFFVGKGEFSPKYLTHNYHFSIDPTICCLRYKHAQLTENAEYGRVSGVHDAVKQESSKYDREEILEILVNYSTFLKIVDSALDQDYENEKKAFEIIKELLQSINTALGKINDLDLHYEEEIAGGVWCIVDRNNIVPENLPELSLVGLNSIFTDIGLSSKISNEIGSQISISAQGSRQNFKDNVGAILKWNQGVVDRFKTLKSDTTTISNGVDEVDKEQKKKRDQWKVDVIEFFKGYNRKGWKDEELQAAKTFHAEDMIYYMEQTKKTKQEPIPGVIPVELSLSLEGVGGLRIAEAFKTSRGILPGIYRDRFGYLITGLEHEIQGNKWTTKVNAMFTPIDKPSKDEAPTNYTSTDSPDTSVSPPFVDATPIVLQGPITSAQEFWTLVAVCSREDSTPQGRADVAQSIYNRVGSKAYGGNNITKVVLGKWQYEPTWRYPSGARRGDGVPNAEWFKIVDINSAAAATGLPTTSLQAAAQSILNKDLQAEAQKFIQGRTDFLGIGQPAKTMTANKSKKQRTPRSNQFGFSYNYNKNVIYPVPEYIKNFKI